MSDTVEQGQPPPTTSTSSASSISVTVKTLDSQNHEFTVPEDMLVKDFKTEILEKVGIPADQQRLIFRGRVLQDDKKMGECNVANSTIHVVARPANSSRTNDEPPPRPPSSNAGRMADGMQGIVIAAQTGPIPNFGPRCSASARLQASNHMLARASTFLRRIEEEESINLGGGGGTATGAAGVPPPQLPTGAPLANNNSGPGNEMEVDDEGEEVWEESNSFNNIISQIASAAATASLAGMQGNNNSPAATTPTLTTTAGNGARGQSQGQPPAPVVGATLGPVGGSFVNPPSTPGSGSRTPTNAGRRPESPRLEEMATVIEGIISFNERLAPYLRFLETALRTNRQYINVEEQASVQYLFDTLSSTMHYMSHSYHALSDMICDFSTPASTRRLRAATAVVLETSTMLRASIPIAVPVGYVGMPPQQPQQQPPAQQNLTSQPPPSQPPVGVGAAPADAAATPPTSNPVMPGIQGQHQHPNQNIVQAVGAQIAQMLQGGGGAGGGQFNLGNLGHGNFEAQIHVGIDNGMDGGGGVISMQDLAQMLGPMGGGMMMQQQQQVQGQQGQGHWQAHSGPAGPQPQQVQGQGQPQSQPGTPTHRNNNNGTGGRPNRGGQGGPNNGNFRLAQQGGGPFDVLVPCNSHHGWRTMPGPRPPSFNQHVNANVQRSGDVGPSQSQGQGFLATGLSVLLQSNILSALQPAAQDIIVNYLMRGRDAKNKEHLKSCAKKLSRNLAPFFETFTNNVAARDMGVDYRETFVGVLTEFLAELFHLTVSLPSGEAYQYHSAVVSAADKLARQILVIFRYCFKDLPGNGFEGFAEYIVDTLFSGCSLLLQDEIRRTVTDYFKRHSPLDSTDVSTTRPMFVQLKKENATVSSPTLSGATGSASTSTSTPSSATTRPVTSLSKSSPDVVPPKQAKQSDPSPSRPPPQPVMMVGEEDLDDFLDLQATPPRPTVGVNVNAAAAATATPVLPGAGRLPPQMEAAMRNIPSDWVETVQRDLQFQWGMPEQPPFSPAYSGIFSKKSS